MAENKRFVLVGAKTVETNGDKKTFWNRIGRAFQNRDGSFNLKFDYFPVRDDGTMTVQLREDKPKTENNGGNHEPSGDEIF